MLIVTLAALIICTLGFMSVSGFFKRSSANGSFETESFFDDPAGMSIVSIPPEPVVEVFDPLPVAPIAEDARYIYLTFDDGPSTKSTPAILDILKEENVKATFFILGNMVKQNPEMLKRIHNEGHEIALHSYAHDYGMYRSIDSFFADFDACEKIVKDTINYKANFFRFPGGSNNVKITQSFRNQVVPMLEERGYTPVDWNSDTGDAASKDVPSVQKLVNNGLQSYNSRKELIILAHDTNAKINTPEATRQMIRTLKERNCEFLTMSSSGTIPLFGKVDRPVVDISSVINSESSAAAQNTRRVQYRKHGDSHICENRFPHRRDSERAKRHK